MADHPILEFLLGFFITLIILYVHAKATLSQIFGFITDTKAALLVSLAISIALLIIFIIVVILSITTFDAPMVAVGGVVGVLFAYILSESVRLGFAIFFEFI